MIYHIVRESEFRSRCSAGLYRPESLESEGFVHCADRAVALTVADDYFADVDEALLILEVDPDALSARTVYESPVPIEGGGRAHLGMATEFPHVYGPIEIEAVPRVGVLQQRNGYQWPEQMLSPASFLSGS